MVHNPHTTKRISAVLPFKWRSPGSLKQKKKQMRNQGLGLRVWTGTAVVGVWGCPVCGVGCPVSRVTCGECICTMPPLWCSCMTPGWSTAGPHNVALSWPVDHQGGGTSFVPLLTNTPRWPLAPPPTRPRSPRPALMIWRVIFSVARRP